MKHVLTFLLCIVGVSLSTKAQTGFSFNFNIENGLPDNQVYGVITDKHGYLWIATRKGVVKYNGYDFKLFNLSDGLPNEDVWELTEDRKGRIWLSNISDEFGYVYNDKYHKTVVRGSGKTIYPTSARSFEDGIIFSSLYVHGNGRPAICIAGGDTIYTYSVAQKSGRKKGAGNGGLQFPSQVYFDATGAPIILFDKTIYRISRSGPYFKYTELLKLDSFSRDLILASKLYGNHFVSFYVAGKAKKVFVLNLNCNQKNVSKEQFYEVDLDKFDIKGGVVVYSVIDIYNKVFYVVADEHIMAFDYEHDGLTLKGKFNVSDLISDERLKGTDIRTVIWSDFWGKCICTIHNGLWFNHNIDNNFIRAYKFDIRDYQMAGRIKDSLLFLWNPRSSKIAMIDEDLKVSYYEHKGLTTLKSVIHFHGDTFLVTGNVPFFFLNGKDKRVISCSEKRLNRSSSSSIVDSEGRFFFIDNRSFSMIDKTNEYGSEHVYDLDRYNGLLYDSKRGNYWVYNYDKVLIREKQKNVIISKDKLSDFGVKKIEKVIVDNRYGNIFFKGTNNVTIYDPDQNRFLELFENINLKESSIFVYDSVFIAAGRFGVLFSKILGPLRISEPIVYPNMKNINYNSVYDCFASWGQVILNTDKGVYKVDIPSDSELLLPGQDNLFPGSKFIINYRDSISNFKSGDTVLLNQNYRRMQFDVINPLGNGKLKYTYRFSDDSAWSELNANELTLPLRFKPGVYYKLSLKVYDNVWRSNPTSLYFYIRPYWWQTNTGLTVIWSGIAFLVLLLFVIAVLVTRKLVLEATKKRNLRMELELKAIYAQINPHFIFNTLNSALLLVNKNKMDEAYTHISKFSRLLRAYIKSSRNKLITVAEEIVNLKDYIELQQTRFKNKFEYELRVDKRINPEHVMIPSLLVQPFVENAINHGILPKKDTGNLKVEFKITAEKNEIICIIEDDGIGRAQSRAEHEHMEGKNTSYGDLLIKDLVNIFNKYENMNIEIRYTDKPSPLTGTIVTIQIKNPHHA